jgi:metal-responsive CopG/Arc/MetJ family transcriptional regulator
MSNYSKEFNPTPEEKALFLMQNSKVTFWADKELVKKFDEVLKAMNVKHENGSANRKEAIMKLMEKFIEKNSKYLS